MEEYRTLLDGAVGTPPPSTVDIDRIVVTGRRGERARTAALLAGTATLAAAVLAGAAVLVSSARPAPATGSLAAPAGGQPAVTTVAPTHASKSRQPSRQPSTSVTNAPGRLPSVDGLPDWPVWPTWPVSSDSAPGFDRLAAPRLSLALGDEIRRLPGPVAVKAPGGTTAFMYIPGVGYTAKVLITHDGLYGWVLVRVSWFDQAPCRVRRDAAPLCPPQFGAHGESIYRWIGPVGKVADFGFNAVIQHPDGTQVSLSVVAADESGKVTEFSILPLTMNDLVQIGLDPRLSLRD
jgi:hypothetical protein